MSDNDRPTPETDAWFGIHMPCNTSEPIVWKASGMDKCRPLCERLERERDDARGQRSDLAARWVHADLLSRRLEVRLARMVRIALGWRRRAQWGSVCGRYALAESISRADRAEAIIADTLRVLPVGYIPAHVAESIPGRVADLVREVGEQCARADRAEAALARMNAERKPTTENRDTQPTPETANATVHAVCRELDDFDAVPAEVCAEIERDRDNWRAMAVMSPERLDAALRDRERTAKRLRRMVGIALGYRRQRDAARASLNDRIEELSAMRAEWAKSEKTLAVALVKAERERNAARASLAAIWTELENATLHGSPEAKRKEIP